MIKNTCSIVLYVRDTKHPELITAELVAGYKTAFSNDIIYCTLPPLDVC